MKRTEKLLKHACTRFRLLLRKGKVHEWQRVDVSPYLLRLMEILMMESKVSRSIVDRNFRFEWNAELHLDCAIQRYEHTKTVMCSEWHAEDDRAKTASCMCMCVCWQVFLLIILHYNRYFFSWKFNESVHCRKLLSLSLSLCRPRYLYALHSAMHHLQSFPICRFAFEWTQTWTYMHGKVCWALKSICRLVRCWRRSIDVIAVVVGPLLLLLAALSSFSFGRHYYVNGISNRFVMLLKKQYSWLQFIKTCTFRECIRIQRK